MTHLIECVEYAVAINTTPNRVCTCGCWDIELPAHGRL